MRARIVILVRVMLMAAVALPGCTGASLHPAAEGGHPGGDSFDEAMQAWMRSHHVPGMAIVISTDGQISRARGYGWADLEEGIAIEPDTGLWLCSVSKPVIATAIMMLVEEGKVDLDESIARYFDSAPAAWKNITIRNLLNHTSGIADFVNDPLVVRQLNLLGWRIAQRGVNLGADHSQESILRLLTRQPLKFEPGTRASYSSSGYELLGMIIGKVTGQRYEVFLRERIFAPLGMNDTYVYGEAPRGRKVARGYWWRNGGSQRARSAQPTIDQRGYACGGIVTTAIDLAKWDAALVSGKLISQDALKQMFSAAKLNDGSEVPFGLGFGLGHVGPRRWISHLGRWGDFGGYASYYQHFIDDRVTINMLVNQPNIDWSSLPREIWKPYFPETPSRSPAP